MGARDPRRLDDLAIRGAGTPVGDGLAHGDVEEERLLRQDRHVLAQIGDRDLAQIVAIDQDAAGARIVQPQEEPRGGRFAGPALPDKRQCLSGRQCERDIRQRIVSAPG